MTNAEKTKAEAAGENEISEDLHQSRQPDETPNEQESKLKKEKTKKQEMKKSETGKKKTKTTEESKQIDKDKKIKVKKEEKKEIEKKEPTPGEKEEEKKENDLSVNFAVKVSHTKVEEELEDALVKYSTEIKLPGFRQGKVPIDVIKSRYKDAIREEVLNKVVEKAVFEKIEADKLRILSRPEVKNIDYKEGKDVTADIEVEVFPTVDIPYLETIEVKIPAKELKVDDYDEQKQIELVLEAQKRQAPVKREIIDNDYAMLKLQSKILQTKRMTPRKSTYYMVNQESSFEILDLYKEIIGKNINDSLTIRRTYPGDYHKKPWAGKEVEHYITIENVYEWVKPNLDKDFLKSVGFEDEESFKKKLKEEYDRMNSQQIEDKKLKHIIDNLCETIVFPLPRGMVEQEVARMASQQQQQHPVDFKDEKQIKEYMESLKSEAETSIRFTFIIEAIQEKFNLEVTNDDLEKQYKSIAEKNKVEIKEVRKVYMNKENSQNLKDTLIREKVMELIKGKVKIKEV